MSQATLEEQMQNMPPQKQSKPGIQQQMTPKPLIDDPNYRAAGKLINKVALITGGDSGIGASIAVLYAREGADVAIVYLAEEEEDAQETKKRVEKYGRKCLLIAGDITDKTFCRKTVDHVFQQFGKLDILVNNAAVQYESESILDMDMGKMEKTFQTNIFAMFYLCQAAIPYLSEYGSIINTSSVNSHKGHDTLMDYTSTKGAIDAFTISLAQQLADKKSE